MANEEKGIYSGDSRYEYRDGCSSCADFNPDYSGYGLMPVISDEVTNEQNRHNACVMTSYYSRCNNKKQKTSRLSKTVMQKQTDVRPILEVKLRPNGKVYDQDIHWGGEVHNGVMHDFSYEDVYE